MQSLVAIVVATVLGAGSLCAAELPTDVRRTICSAFRNPSRAKEIVARFRGPLLVQDADVSKGCSGDREFSWNADECEYVEDAAWASKPERDPSISASWSYHYLREHGREQHRYILELTVGADYDDSASPLFESLDEAREFASEMWAGASQRVNGKELIVEVPNGPKARAAQIAKLSRYGIEIRASRETLRSQVLEPLDCSSDD